MLKEEKMKIRKINKKGQEIMGMSFSVIFSLLLIVFFIVVAFIAINAFLKTKKCAEVGLFVDDFQTEIQRAWNSQKDNFEFKRSFPSNIDYVCFANLSNGLKGPNTDIGDELGIYEVKNANMFFYPIGNACGMPYIIVKHLDVDKINVLENPYCIKVENGLIKIRVEKGFNERLVSASRSSL